MDAAALKEMLDTVPLKLEPGGIYVLRAPCQLSMEQREGLEMYLRERFADMRFLILEDGLELVAVGELRESVERILEESRGGFMQGIRS